MSIVDRVFAERAAARRTIAAGSVAIALGVVGAVFWVGAIILGRGRWLSLPAAVPFMWWGIAAVLAIFAVRLLPRRLGARATDEAVARAAEGERGLRDGALVGLVQIAGAGGVLTRLRTDQLTAMVGSGALAPRHARHLMVIAFAALAGTIAVISGTVASATRYADGWRALALPFAAARGDLLPSLSLDETPAALLRGEALTAVVAAEGRRTVSLSWRETGMAWRDTTVRVTDGRATVALGSVEAALTLVATDGRTTSDSLAISVHERPFAGDVSVRAVYPAYLDMPAEVLSPDGALRFPEGTTLEIVARTAGLASVALTDARDTIPLTIEAGRARARIVARSGGTWQWTSTTPIADLPPPLVLDVVPDLAPDVEFISPSRDTLVSPDDEVRLVLAAVDDHGLNGVLLKMTRERRNGERDGEDTHRITGARGDRWLGELTVSLVALDLNPGDAVSIVAEARDAAPWGRVGTSQRVVLRVPTADEQRDAATDAADSTLEHVAAAVEAQRGLERRTAEAARTGDRTAQGQESGGTAEQRGQGASYEAQERARELMDQQRAVGAMADTLSKEAQQLAEELKKAGVLDSALSAQLREVERLLQQAMTPEMRQQMRDLEQNRQQMSGDELQQALSKMQQPQQNTLESLEKAYEMLKRAALEGQMQSLSDKAADLAAQQKQFADSAGANSSQPPPPATAKDLADRAAAIQREAQELIDRLQREQADAAKGEVQNAAAEAAESARRMQEALRRAMEQMGVQDSLQQQQQQRGQQQQQQQQQAGQQGGQGGQGGQSSVQMASQQAASAMQDASDSFAQARQQQVDAWKRELTDALDRSIQETLQMARQQEQLGQQAQQGAGQQQLRAEQGALQQGVQQTAERVADQGQKSALVSPTSQRAMDAARQRVEQATRDVNDGASGQQASQAMQDAADALRQAATAMARDRERAGSSRTASGLPELMQQMREMANQQGQLNGQAASMLPSMGQMAAGSPEKQQQLQQLADRQRELAQRLEDAADADRTGRADAMAREARQIAQQMERGLLDPSVIDRQQRLFRRMLDAGRTLEQDGREESNRREARAGGNLASDAPGSGVARGADAVKFREPTYDELRGYSAEERRIIIEYFRRMNARER